MKTFTLTPEQHGLLVYLLDRAIEDLQYEARESVGYDTEEDQQDRLDTIEGAQRLVKEFV